MKRRVSIISKSQITMDTKNSFYFVYFASFVVV
jgi:hypothetical protein